MKMLKLCMIGSRGHFGYGFENPDALRKDVAVFSGCGDSAEKLLSAARDNGYEPELHADWRKMLEMERPDLVCIASPFEKHVKMCVAVMDMGIHIFCENRLH